MSGNITSAIMSLIEQNGGVGGLLERFQQSGLADKAQSWIGTGQNQPVSQDDLHNVFGREQLEDVAQQHGLATHDLLGQLSQYLPQMVDHLTPGGQMPQQQGQSWMDMARSFLQR